jgi:hypothetical protein
VRHLARRPTPKRTSTTITIIIARRRTWISRPCSRMTKTSIHLSRQREVLSYPRKKCNTLNRKYQTALEAIIMLTTRRFTKRPENVCKTVKVP